MPPQTTAGDDPANGYETVAARFMERRNRSRIGEATVRAWARALPAGASVLDLGCGHGVPVSTTLVDEGLIVWGIDASPTLVAAFRQSLPHARVACETVETSTLFDRTFDAAIAVGLLFLLPANAQRDLIHRVGRALHPGGRFLFTAPAQACTWTDVLTGQSSQSLGADEYTAALAATGLDLVAAYSDEGENHYYDVRRT